MHQDWINALVGGLIIGISASLFLLTTGRVSGISGIFYGLVSNFEKSAPEKEIQTKEISWRFLFILGLLSGGLVFKVLSPEVFIDTTPNNFGLTILAGLLVGFGTALGGGCTSGHGVCGISRFSIRSIVATVLFIFVGAVVVFLIKSGAVA
jgi:uncharacterized protein